MWTTKPLWPSVFISEITTLPSVLTSSTYDTWPRAYQPTAPTAGTLLEVWSRPLATFDHSEALPQWRPSNQLLKARPLRWPSR